MDKRNKYYPGTEEEVISPFYVVSCGNCGYLNWHMHSETSCPRCGKNAECCPANEWEGKKA